MSASWAPPPRSPRPAGVTALAAFVALLGSATFDSAEQPATQSAGQAVSSHGKPSLETATIEAKRKRKEIEREVSHFVFTVPFHYLDDSLGAVEYADLPAGGGTPVAQGEFVRARLSQAVTAAKAPLAGEHCQPNFYVVVTRSPGSLLDKWCARDRGMFSTRNGLGPLKSFLHSNRPVRVWYNTDFASPKGTLIPANSGVAALLGVRRAAQLDMAQVPTNIVGAATRLSRSAVQSLSSVIVVVGAKADREPQIRSARGLRRHGGPCRGQPGCGCRPCSNDSERISHSS